ncbi:hypothetical protein J132_06874, partial [Termitomyces sp. J132]
GLTMQLLPKPIPIFNIDQTPNEAGTISSMVDLVCHYQNHAEHSIFAITSLGKQDMILGFTWLREHNLKVKWARSKVAMSWCPCRYSICTTEVKEECWA